MSNIYIYVCMYVCMCNEVCIHVCKCIDRDIIGIEVSGVKRKERGGWRERESLTS